MLLPGPDARFMRALGVTFVYLLREAIDIAQVVHFVLNDLLPKAPGIRLILVMTSEASRQGMGEPNLLKFLELIKRTEYEFLGEARQRHRGQCFQNKSIG